MLSKRILVLMFVVAFLFVGCLPTPTPPNGAPIITSDPITTATVGVLYTYNVNATDPDDDALTYSLITKPSGMIINSVTGVIFWTPIAVQVGNNSVIVKVSDGSLSITQSFIIKVSKPAPIPINHAPVIYSTPITTATVWEIYIYDVNATDPDGDILFYSLTAKPSGMTINSASGLIWWNPTSAQVGNHLVTVRAFDGVLDDTQSFTVKVSKLIPTPINQKPVITPIPDDTAIVGEAYTYDVNATDPDGDILTYSLTTLPIGMAINSATGVISWIPTSAQVGNNTVKVGASDGVLSDTQSFTIVVSEPSVPTKTYTITTSAGLGGSITPSGVVTVEEGLDKVFIITPGSVFYSITDVLVDGSSVGTVDSYSFINVDKNHSISAYFSPTKPVYNQDQKEHYDTIYDAIEGAIANETILVSAGVYNEDVTIYKSLILVSAEGKYNTIINGLSTAYMGAVKITANNVVLGGVDAGFTINGAGEAAVYLSVTSGVTIRGNTLVAATNRTAFEAEGGQSNHAIEGNTFQGDASQLVYVNGQTSVSNASVSVDFIGNIFSGTATGPALGQEADNSEISGNIFATVADYKILELFGTDNTVTGNDFTADLPVGSKYVLDGFGTYDLAKILVDNTFLRDVGIIGNAIVVK